VELAEWARANGVRPQTAYRWFREDRMPVAARRLESGAIWVDAVRADESGRVVVYARVSSRDRRHDLDRQVAVNPAPAAAGQDRDRLTARRGCLMNEQAHLRSSEGNGINSQVNPLGTA
jgi:predicted site-specific integrase-resolvase